MIESFQYDGRTYSYDPKADGTIVSLDELLRLCKVEGLLRAGHHATTYTIPGSMATVHSRTGRIAMQKKARFTLRRLHAMVMAGRDCVYMSPPRGYCLPSASEVMAFKAAGGDIPNTLVWVSSQLQAPVGMKRVLDMSTGAETWANTRLNTACRIYKEI